MMLPLALLLSFSASPYQKARDRAQDVPNLGRFLETYVGDCESDDPGFDRKSCEVEAKSQRKRFQGRLLRLEVDDLTDLLRVKKFERGVFHVLLTPIFSERGLGLSVGRPRLNREGYPVVRQVPIKVKLPKGEPEFAFRRQLDRGMVRMELLVKPKSAWRKKKRDGEALRGAEVALVGVRVYGTRGDVLAEQTY